MLLMVLVLDQRRAMRHIKTSLTLNYTCIWFLFSRFASQMNTCWKGFNVGRNSLEDQMDLMNTHLLTSWVLGNTHILGDQMDFGEIHMTSSWIWGIHSTLIPTLSNPPSVEDGRKQNKH